jgi:hypothetical protein
MLTITKADAMRASVAGGKAASVRKAAEVLFEAGGRRVLPGAVQEAVRGVVEREASRMLTAGALESAVAGPARVLETGTARAVAALSARAAARQVLRAVTAAAGAGAVIDGGFAVAHAVVRLRQGTMSRGQAVAHVAREAATGAAATAAGAATAVALVTLTGGMAAPAVFVVGAAASLGAKAGIDAWLARKGRGAIRVSATQELH